MSLTIKMLILGILTSVVSALDIPIAPADLDTGLKVMLMIVSYVGAWYGRVRVGDINIVGARKI